MKEVELGELIVISYKLSIANIVKTIQIKKKW